MGCAPSNARAGNQSTNPTKKADANKDKPVVVFVLGGPGSGKGTQCERIVRDYGFTHFSVGDLLRAEKESGSETAKMIDDYIKEGKLVPAKIPVSLLKKAMEKAGWTDNYYLIDGFPRNQENLEAWEEIFRTEAEVKFTLFYECSLETMEKRILERSKISGRSDDNPESLKKRFVTYEAETKPVVEIFTNKGLIRRINAERDVEAVYADTKAALDAIKDQLKKANKPAKETAAPAEGAAVQAASPAKQEAAPVKQEVAPTKQEAAPAQEQQAAPAKQEAAPAQEQQAHQQDSKPSAIFVLGGPGSGKGTQCERIIADFGLKHLSVGDLLRAEKAAGTELAKEIDEYMTQGKLVPSEVPVRLLKNAIDAAPKGTNFLIDGFPRNRENIEVWNKMIGDAVSLKNVLFFQCSFETMEKRILERAKVSGRSDDNIESLKKRFDTYQTESAPVVEDYEKEGVVTKINAERDIAEVYADTKKTLEALLR